MPPPTALVVNYPANPTAETVDLGQWKLGLGVFVVGWIFQFLGHAVEGKPPEFFKDWRFLFVGLRWWAAKVSGRPLPPP